MSRKASPEGCSGPVRLYRFYNMEVSRYGEPFALCDGHRKEQPIPAACTLDCMADNARRECAFAIEREMEEICHAK
jgi:hypothetical protein